MRWEDEIVVKALKTRSFSHGDPAIFCRVRKSAGAYVVDHVVMVKAGSSQAKRRYALP